MSLWVVPDVWPHEHFFCSYRFCEYSKQVEWWTNAFISPEYIPRSEIVESLHMVYFALGLSIREFPKVVVPIRS